MPPTPYPRRVWAGVTVEISTPPTIGAEVFVERSVTDIVEKDGSDGRFAIVTVTTSVTSPDATPLLVETARLAYRPAPESRSAGVSPSHQPLEVTTGEWLTHAEDGWRASPDSVVLMRYSALTANGHRIHYDFPYVTQVEGYPSVLVHGPLMATMVAESVRRDNPDRELTAFSCRAHRPYFLGSDATIRRTGSSETTVEYEVRDDAGGPDAPPNLTATVTLR
jgi:3-methylfumaryl-CoA hydratase